ncbi:hypothetical protein EDD86DRAFT_204174 [Gorgonomyces haynaldii]|nr:hypothetical protein EDD86DRAFT_204174 [Gorgonomyces haynaldii]
MQPEVSDDDTVHSQNEDLEQLYLQLFKKLDQYQDMIEAGQQQLKSGYFDLAKAKYCGTLIDRFHYDMNMKPTLLFKDNQLQSVDGKDPTTMFGVLVPQSLKRSAKSFRQGLELYLNTIAIQSDLDKLVNEITEAESSLALEELVLDDTSDLQDSVNS